MMKKPHPEARSGTSSGRKNINVRIDPTVNEGPVTIRFMEQQIHRLEDTVRRQEGEITALRQLLVHQSVTGHWEVPG